MPVTKSNFQASANPLSTGIEAVAPIAAPEPIRAPSAPAPMAPELPQKIVEDTRASQFMQGLSQLSSSVGNLGKWLKADNAKKEEEETRAAYMSFLSGTELPANMDDLSEMSSIQTDATLAAMGETLGIRLVQEFQENIASGKITLAQARVELPLRIEAASKTFPDDKFTNKFEPYATAIDGSLKELELKETQEETNRLRMDSESAYWIERSQGMDSMSASEINESTQAFVTQRETESKLKGPDVNKVMWNHASAQARFGNIDYVNAILDAKRGPNADMPSLRETDPNKAAQLTLSAESTNKSQTADQLFEQRTAFVVDTENGSIATNPLFIEGHDAAIEAGVTPSEWMTASKKNSETKWFNYRQENQDKVDALNNKVRAGETIDVNDPELQKLYSKAALVKLANTSADNRTNKSAAQKTQARQADFEVRKSEHAINLNMATPLNFSATEDITVTLSGGTTRKYTAEDQKRDAWLEEVKTVTNLVSDDPEQPITDSDRQSRLNLWMIDRDYLPDAVKTRLKGIDRDLASDLISERNPEVLAEVLGPQLASLATYKSLMSQGGGNLVDEALGVKGARGLAHLAYQVQQAGGTEAAAIQVLKEKASRQKTSRADALTTANALRFDGTSGVARNFTDDMNKSLRSQSGSTDGVGDGWFYDDDPRGLINIQSEFREVYADGIHQGMYPDAAYDSSIKQMGSRYIMHENFLVPSNIPESFKWKEGSKVYMARLVDANIDYITSLGYDEDDFALVPAQHGDSFVMRIVHKETGAPMAQHFQTPTEDYEYTGKDGVSRVASFRGGSRTSPPINELFQLIN